MAEAHIRTLRNGPVPSRCMMCCVVRRLHALPSTPCRTCPSSAVAVHRWHGLYCTLRRILRKGYASTPAVGALERAATWHGYVAHVQGQGAVAFIGAGTLELDGSTIANTASTTVRAVARLGAIEAAAVTRAGC
jgi:hypothetical protein